MKRISLFQLNKIKLKEINLIKTTALVEPTMESIYVGKTCSPCATLVVPKYDCIRVLTDDKKIQCA